MAVEPTLKITPINLAKKTFRVTATYTDSADPENPKVIPTITAILSTTSQKLAVLATIDASYKALLIRETNIATLIGDMETSGAANLKARL